MKKVYGFTSLIALALGGCATYNGEGMAAAPVAPAAEASAAMPAPATAQNDDLAELVDQVQIPYEVFTLKIGHSRRLRLKCCYLFLLCFQLRRLGNA